jgi:fructose/tagatose bisphosphate aldolase
VCSSDLYDGSRKEYVDNLMMTKKIVGIAHEKGIVVQAELGNVPYLGEMQMETIDWGKYMMDIGQVEEFVRETGIDTLAVAIGNAHGFFRERKEPDYERLSAIAAKVDLPLVLHGASDWNNGRVAEVIKRGISCFNVDTAVRVAFISGLREALSSEEETDLRKVMGSARSYAANAVKEKMLAFGSAGKA